MTPCRSKRFLPPLEWQETAFCANTPCTRYRIMATITPMHQLINFLTSYIKDSDRRLSGEQRLWAAVIRQSALDCAAKWSSSKTDLHRAQTFLRRKNYQLQLICDYAGLDMDYVLTMSRRKIVKPKRSYMKIGFKYKPRKPKLHVSGRSSSTKRRVSIVREA